MCPQAALHDCRTALFLTRHFHEGALQRMNARVKADPSLMRQRRCAAEHPFGTIKRMTAGGRFLTRGLARVKAEARPATRLGESLITNKWWISRLRRRRPYVVG